MLYVTSCRNLAAQTLPRSGSKNVYHGSNYDQISLVIRGFSGTLTGELQFTGFGILISMKQTGKQTTADERCHLVKHSKHPRVLANEVSAHSLLWFRMFFSSCSISRWLAFIIYFWLHSVHNCVRIHFESLYFKAKNCSNTHSCRPSSFINSTKRNEKITNLPSSASSACSPVNKNQDVYYSWPKSENILTEALSMIKFSS